jgi:putative glutamine transport system permease protein
LFDYNYDFSFVFQPSTLRALWAGLLVTLNVAFWSIVFSFILGAFLGLLRFTKLRFFSRLATIYIETIRNLPLLMIILFVYFYIPNIGFLRLSIGSSVILSMTIFTSALVAEIVRSGLNSVPAGQMEAALAQGMTYTQALRLVVIPQSFRNIIPPLVSQFVSLIKDTTLGVAISLPELLHNAQQLYNIKFAAQIPLLLTVTLIYVVINYTLSLLGRHLERRLQG